MRELFQAIPDPDVLLALEPEELGAKLLFLLRRRTDTARRFHPDSLSNEIETLDHGGQVGYPRIRETEVKLALAEAWAWLEAQG